MLWFLHKTFSLKNVCNLLTRSTWYDHELIKNFKSNYIKGEQIEDTNEIDEYDEYDGDEETNEKDDDGVVNERIIIIKKKM